MDETLNWAISIAHVAEDHKAQQVVILDMREITLVADYFVIMTGYNVIQVGALADHIEDSMTARGVAMLTRVGRGQAQWVLLDYGSVVVHIFTEDARHYYDLERLWGDAEVVLPKAKA